MDLVALLFPVGRCGGTIAFLGLLLVAVFAAFEVLAPSTWASLRPRR